MQQRRGNTTRTGEHGKVEVRFFPGCLVLSIVLSVVGTILLNVLIRLFD
jgi:hypothetical protein